MSERGQGTWKTREGVEIPIQEMSDSHLANTIKFLRRTVGPQKDLRAYAIDSAPVNGEMAQMAVESEARRLYMMDEEDFISLVIPQYDELITEAMFRGLPGLFESEK